MVSTGQAGGQEAIPAWELRFLYEWVLGPRVLRLVPFSLGTGPVAHGGQLRDRAQFKMRLFSSRPLGHGLMFEAISGDFMRSTCSGDGTAS